ncbi:hypothetical protein [Streptomyces sp. NPDC052701]|uniref:hypothetical protein n=1 Tax=Streptomyces sp. NPDC052701 TaxID=3155533 RepID=UPI00343CCC81
MHERGSKGEVLVAVTPVVAHMPEERRHIALDENELATLMDGFWRTERFDAQGLAVLLLGGPEGTFTAKEKGHPEPRP